MNAATEKLFKVLFDAATSNSSGLDGNQSVRPLLELKQEETGNNVERLQKTLDRTEIEDAWLAVKSQSQFRVFDHMKLAMQNDLIAAMHRDLQHRYTGRIARVIHETARKKNHADTKNGLIAIAKTSVMNFLNLRGE